MATEQEKKIAEHQELQKAYDSIGLALDGTLVGMERRKIRREMTTEELLDKREAYAELQGQIADLELDLQCIKQHYSGKIKPLQTQAIAMLSDIRSKMHDVEDDCYVMNDYAQNKVRYVSRVTCQVVEVREMTGADRQKDIDFDNGQDDGTEEGQG